MHLIRLAPLAALLLAGCATHQTRAPKAAPAVAVARVIPMGNPQACSIVLSRGAALVGRLHPDAPVLYVDNQPIAALKVGETLCVEVIDGSHSITMLERRMTIPVRYSTPMTHTFPRPQPLHLEYGQTASGNRITTSLTESTPQRNQSFQR